MAIALFDTEKRRRRRFTFISFTTLEMIGVVFHPAKGTPIQERHFISKTDDDYPIIHKPGFLSLVIPGFGLGPVGFKDAYLTEIQSDGRWQEVSIPSRLTLT
jgi:hypothetical protein